jgi:hypothetical protein
MPVTDNAMASRHLGNIGARLKALRYDPCLLLGRPPPSPARPGNHLDTTIRTAFLPGIKHGICHNLTSNDQFMPGCILRPRENPKKRMHETPIFWPFPMSSFFGFSGSLGISQGNRVIARWGARTGYDELMRIRCWPASALVVPCFLFEPRSFPTSSAPPNSFGSAWSRKPIG